ncbi:MAG: alpha/beta hydrolase, partial [Bacteroidota bacterium]|nr:alpha/beta hydrolase [Bacteroidota bacterium]
MKSKQFLQIAIFIFLILMVFITHAQKTSGNNSYYEGNIKTEYQDILVWISILNENTDSLKAFIDVPEQGAYNTQIDSIRIDGQQIWINIKSYATVFQADFSENREKISGIWNQANQNYELNMIRLEKKPELIRPQEPKEPFPYRSEDVFFDNKSAKIKLAGTLTLPEKSWQAPAVILVPGSGPQNRNSEILGHKPFLVLSDFLTRMGIAVLRYDERGIGESEGKFSTATTFDLSEDVMAAYEYLRNHKGINSEKIGIIGHSEGGLIAP